MSIIPKSVLKMTSRLLLPPDEDLRGEIPTYRARLGLVPAALRGRLQVLLDFLETMPLDIQLEAYHFSFGALPDSSLHLSRYEDGVTGTSRTVRALGILYSKSNYACPPWEDPDFLPVVLDYMASTRDQDAQRFAAWAERPLAEVGHALAQLGSPYQGGIETAIWALQTLGFESLTGMTLTEPMIEESARWEIAYSHDVLGQGEIDETMAQVVRF